jgi:hypothetical protein
MPIASHIPQCQHIKTNGVRCGSPALRGGSFCYFHERSGRLFGAEVPGVLLPLSVEDEDAIQISLMKIIQEIFLGNIELRRAALILRALQISVINSRRLTFNRPSTWREAVRSIPTRQKSAGAPAESDAGLAEALTSSDVLESPPRETGNGKRETNSRTYDPLLKELQRLARTLGSPEAAIKHKATQIAGLGPPLNNEKRETRN